MQIAEFLLRAVLMGIGATMVMDLWVWLQRRMGIKGLDYAMVGRWIGHMRSGIFLHASIASAPAVPHERAIGWLVHYLTGIVFAGLLLGACGLDWARQPTLVPALVTGLLTVAAPFFILQPALGLGIAASKTAKPQAARVRSLMTHLVFGVGLYLAAEAVQLPFG